MSRKQIILIMKRISLDSQQQSNSVAGLLYFSDYPAFQLECTLQINL